MKAGIIGAGFIGQEHLRAMQQCGITEICICDRNEEQARQTAALCNGTVYTNYKAMLQTENLDFVSVCTPTSSHYAMTMDALEAGVAVLCEKPFCNTAEEAATMIAKAKEKRVLLMVGHCLRFGKTYAYLKKCVEDGRFGKLRALTLFRHSTVPTWSTDDWLRNNALSGGAVVDLHIHETDMAVFLLGVPQAVTAVGGYEQCATVYHYADTPMAVSAQSSWRPVTTYPFTGGYDANFEQATILCKGDELKVYTQEGLNEGALATESFPSYITDEGFYVCEMRYFLECLSTGEAPYCPPEDSALSLKVVHAERDSLLQQKTLPIA